MSEVVYPKDNDAQRLLKTVSKKIQTTMIGSLGIIEDKLLNNPKLESVRELLATIYEEEIRHAILDLGNKQIRNTEEEFKNCDVKLRYNYLFKVKQRGE